MEQNACAECGFSTTDWAEFTRHVDRHEHENNVGAGSGDKSAVGANKRLLRRSQQQQRLEPSADSDDHLLLQHREETEEEEEETEAEESEEHSATMLGHLADLSRFLSAASAEHCHQKSGDDEDIGAAGHSASPMSPFAMSTTNNSAHEDSAEPTEDQKPLLSTTTTVGGSKKSGGKGKTTHRCPHCTFTTYMSQHMKSHLRAHENFIGQMYICDVCGMAFSQKANMHRHRGTHSGVKPYECRFCQKKFFRKDQMQEHSMTHIKTGDDFDCPVSGCECKFSQHSMLRQHLDQKHAISSSQQAHCKRCTLQFSNSRRLLLHYQTKHDEYYTSISPVPEGQSPVKRLLNDESNDYSELNHQLPTMPVKSRRSRKRARHHGNGTAVGAAPAKACKLEPISSTITPPPPSNVVGRVNGGGNASSGSGAYNVEELLKLDCGFGAGPSHDGPHGHGQRSSASVSPAAVLNNVNVQEASKTTTKTSTTINGGGARSIHPFAVPSPSQHSSSAASPAAATSLDLFMRDQLFRGCPSSASLLAQQFGAGAPVNPPISAAHFAGQPSSAKDHQHQQQAAAAAAAAALASAQLFMQSLLMQQQPVNNGGHGQADQQEQSQPQGRISGGKVALKSRSSAQKSPPESQQQANHHHRQHFLPLAKSPDCRGLILNGLAKKVAAKSEKKNAAGVVVKCKEEAATSSDSEETKTQQQQRKAKEEVPEEDGGDRVGGPLLMEVDHQQEVETEEMGQDKQHQRTLSPKEQMKQRENMPQPSGHSSATHSPSSSSTASSSSVDCLGGGGSATSSTVENSPLKVLNGKLLSSSGLLGRALMASEGLLKEALNQSGDMDCAHCGLLFTDQTLYLLHKGLHSEADPWRCNLCGQSCSDKYTFTTHMISSDHA